MRLAFKNEVKAGTGSPSPRASAFYLPTLDGWRALAILSVLLNHDRLHTIGGVSLTWPLHHGKCGVDLFFAISGLLICWRLMEEESASGRISLRSFYIRRAFRILPPALAFLCVVGILGLTGVLPVTLGEWLGSTFFFRNYSSLTEGPGHFFTGHFWSLAVEEHFYFILPSLIVLTRKRWRVPLLVAIALLIEAHRAQVLRTKPWLLVQFHTDIRLDALLIGAIFAIILQSYPIRNRAANWLRFWPISLGFVLLVVTVGQGTFWGTTLIAISMPLVILGTVLNPHGYLARVLELSPIRYFGRISYSIYLWQQLLMTGHYVGDFPLGILQRTPLRYVALLAMATASYHFLERPLIRIGHRLAQTPRRGPDSEPDAVSTKTPLRETDAALESRLP